MSFNFDSNTLELGTDNELQLKLNNTGSISKDSNGLYIKLKEVTNINKSGLKSDLNGLQLQARRAGERVSGRRYRHHAFDHGWV